MINLRFMMYSASIAIHFRHLPMRWKTLIAYTLTDQAYAVPITRYEQKPPVHKRWFYLGVSLTMWVVWQTSTIIGAVLGTGIPASWQLEFAIPLTFLALLLPVMKNRKHVLAALSSGIVAVTGQGLPFNLGLVLAMLTGIAVGVFAESRQK
jgi:predicted branched-subunit amino acid permease